MCVWLEGAIQCGIETRTWSCRTEEFLNSIVCLADDFDVDGNDTMWNRGLRPQPHGLSVFLRRSRQFPLRSHLKAYLVASIDYWYPFLVEYHLANSEPGTLRLCTDAVGSNKWVNRTRIQTQKAWGGQSDPLRSWKGQPLEDPSLGQGSASYTCQTHTRACVTCPIYGLKMMNCGSHDQLLSQTCNASHTSHCCAKNIDYNSKLIFDEHGKKTLSWKRVNWSRLGGFFV